MGAWRPGTRSGTNGTRALSRVQTGTFYSGHKATLTISQGRVSFPPHVRIEPSYSANGVDLAQGAFTTHLIGSRVTSTTTPMMVTGAFQCSPRTRALAVDDSWKERL